MFRLVLGLAVVLVALFFPTSAQADTETPLLSDETPTQLAEKLEADGVYVGPGRSDVDADVFRDAVVEAMEQGLEIVVLAPDQPEPTASAFARRMQEKTEVDAAIIFPPDDGQVEAYAAEEFETNRTRAINRAQEQETPGVAIATYVTELQSDDTRSVPLFVLILIAVVLVLLYASYGASSLLERERKKLKVAQN